MSKNAIKNTPTCRGFARGEFLDDNAQSCSIQESSAGVRIWLGVNNKDEKFSILPHGPAQGVHGFGWKEKSLREMFPDCDINIPDRMHLTQRQARKLIPLLQNFVKTGWLYPPRERKPKVKKQPDLVIGFND